MSRRSGIGKFSLSTAIRISAGPAPGLSRVSKSWPRYFIPARSRRWLRKTPIAVSNSELFMLELAKRVLVVAAHPDDMEAVAGGTVALLTKAGAQVHLLLCTSGDLGSHAPGMTRARL